MPECLLVTRTSLGESVAGDKLVPLLHYTPYLYLCRYKHTARSSSGAVDCWSNLRKRCTAAVVVVFLELSMFDRRKI